MTGINGSRGWSILLASVMASMMGSGSGVYMYMEQVGPTQLEQMARPDPATGTELRALQGRLERHLQHHPDEINRFDRRITRLETQIEVVIRNQNTILETINRRRIGE